MKKLLGLFSGVLLVLGLAASASAVPMTWTDSIDFDPDVHVPPTLNYYHDISDDGFSTSTTGGDDTISGFSLSIELYDDNADEAIYGLVRHGFLDWRYEQTGTAPDGTERAFINVSLLDWNWFDINGYTAVIDASFVGAVDIFDDGTLNVSISANWGGYGDFMVDSSYLEVYGDDGSSNSNTAPGGSQTPEPTTMLLLGLLGFAGVSRKKTA